MQFTHNAMVSRSSLFTFLSLLLVVLLSGCASNPVRVDTDQSFDFTEVKSYAVISINAGDSLGANRLIQSTTEYLRQNGKIVGDQEFVDAVIELDHFEQERANQSSFSIGLGTGSYGRSGGIGVGGGVSVPIGDDTLLDAVVVVKVLVNDRLVWSANHRAEIDTDKPGGTANAQLKALDGLLKKLPLGQ